MGLSNAASEQNSLKDLLLITAFMSQAHGLPFYFNATQAFFSRNLGKHPLSRSAIISLLLTLLTSFNFLFHLLQQHHFSLLSTASTSSTSVSLHCPLVTGLSLYVLCEIFLFSPMSKCLHAPESAFLHLF